MISNSTLITNNIYSIEHKNHIWGYHLMYPQCIDRRSYIKPHRAVSLTLLISIGGSYYQRGVDTLTTSVPTSNTVTIGF